MSKLMLACTALGAALLIDDAYAAFEGFAS
jgi:hypothetical protein